jgi:hypothetical protein
MIRDDGALDQVAMDGPRGGLGVGFRQSQTGRERAGAGEPDSDHHDLIRSV